MVQDVRVTDGLMTPDGKPIIKTNRDKENVSVGDGERTFYEPSAAGFGSRLNEADAHPSVDAPDVLLRVVK